MVMRAGEESSPRRLAIRLGILLGLLIAAFVATVATLNATLYSASGFASSYLDSLDRHDVAAALAMPGVDAPDAAPTLLTPDALADISSFSLVSDEDQGDGRHVATFDVVFAGDTKAEVAFAVQQTGSRMGVFSAWQFSESPLAVLEVTPQNDPRFDINGIEIVGSDGGNAQYRYQVLTPGLFVLSHESKYLSSPPAYVVVDNSVDVTSVRVDTQPSEEFIEQVNLELANYLDECATQKRLFPTGCPFGQEISNRIVGDPLWSIAQYPSVEIIAGDKAGVWEVPPTEAAAHLTVDVKSLFDGSVSAFSEDVPFTVEYTVTFPGDGSLEITPR